LTVVTCLNRLHFVAISKVSLKRFVTHAVDPGFFQGFAQSEMLALLSELDSELSENEQAFNT